MGVVPHDCDPDLSRTGLPVWAAPGERPAPSAPGWRSTLLLLGVLLGTAFLAAGGSPLGIAVPAGAVALLTAWVLVRRAVRLVRPAVAPAR